MTQSQRGGGTQAWWIREFACELGSSVTLLAMTLAVASVGCGPDNFPGREGFTEAGLASATGTGTGGMTETGVEETETETGEPECPELIAFGNVSINSLEELELLDGVTAIEGNVEIGGVFGELELGLDQLRCLESVGGFLYVHDTDIADFTGLERLRQVGDYFYIGQTVNLRDFTGLSALRSVGSFLHVTENFALQSTVGSDLLVEIGDFLSISDNPQLQDLFGFFGVAGIGGQLRIEQNVALPSLAGLDNLRGVGGDFGVLNNPALSDTSALANIERIDGNTLWQNNPGVGTLNLHSLLTIKGYLILNNMPNLQHLDDLFGLQGINNSLFIWETGLTQIDGFADLEFIGGDIWIESNPNLDNVDGLISLSEAFGAVRVEQNPNLTSAVGLANLVNANGGLSLWGNGSLTAVNLDKLEFVAEYLRVGYSPLQAMAAPKLEVVAGEILVFGMGGATAFTDISALTTVAGRLYYRDNASLTSIDYPSLTQVFGRVQFINNGALTNLDGLGSLELAQEVNIRENFQLNNVAGLSNLSEVPGIFKIVENEGLSSLAGFDQLTGVGGDFHIRDNLNLQAVPGLQALSAVGGDVVITGNAELPTCTAQGVADQLTFIGGLVDLTGNLADGCSP